MWGDKPERSLRQHTNEVNQPVGHGAVRYKQDELYPINPKPAHDRGLWLPVLKARSLSFNTMDQTGRYFGGPRKVRRYELGSFC